MSAELKPMMRAAIYVRASTKEQTQSCDGQLRECRAKAKTLKLNVVDTFVDDGISGQRTDRPSYLRMLAAANAKEFDVLILFAQSRLGRDALEAEKAMRILEFHGVRIVSLDGYDTLSGAAGSRKLMRGVKNLMNEQFIEDLRVSVHRGQHDAFLKGYHTGGKIYGYQLVPVLHATQLNPYGQPLQIATVLKIDPVQTVIVKEIFKRYAGGESPQTIAADLNARGIASPGSSWKRVKRRCAGWARSGIWVILHNALYSGTCLWDQYAYMKFDNKKSKARKAVSDFKGEVGNRPHLRIVDAKTWDAVVARRDANKVKKPGDRRAISGGKAKYLLSGLLKCACGSHFVLDSSTHYRCSASLDGEACSKGNGIRVKRSVAESVILKPVVDELLSPAGVADTVEYMKKYFREKVAASAQAKIRAPAEVIELDAKIARLKARLKAGDDDLSADDLQGIIAMAESRKEQLMMVLPGRQREDKVVALAPTLARAFREKIRRGLAGHPADLAGARLAVRQLLGNEITLKPAPDRSHLVAHLAFRQAALLGTGTAGGRYRD